MENSITTHPATTTTFRTVQIDGLDIFYREAGPAGAPVILFLHGFPSSSHMYRDILRDLADRYHVIAPDYPGFGLSSTPSLQEFEYTFDRLAAVMEQFIDKLGLQRFSLYLQDYGGPVGFRIISKRPELVQALILQNANAYLDGLGPEVQEMGRIQASGDEDVLQQVIDYMVSLEGIKEQYLHGAAHPENVSPDAWLSDHYFIERPGNKAIQAALLKNYHTNFPLYDNWHTYFRTHQPPALITWGRNDKIFIAPGAEAYTRDLQDTELHLLDGGHFALEEYHGVIAELIHQFLQQRLK
ncbi:alpha/beta fold hydrolase [Chitinophaga japonensis]|uniref:Pimeloyl-ACP methyl ester carboxylesterase n=1 Tax=Chitinophaga japonensis TaxID=104662 RepID=A0A562T453_CHIJA|nr:alpha/beta hydrolase [Chitinophaga japonensis]TWI88058.1 pimeloyl-ACP methyl ester carboxylesterase [Chitinophaga japonensis]